MADITGTDAADRLLGGTLEDLVQGLGGNDQLFGKGGDDTLFGGEGDDRLDGGAGADAMAGGLGDDSYVVDDAGDTVTEVDGEGRDTVTARASWTLAAGVSVERLVATAGVLTIDLTGNERANQIYGNDAANVLTGGGGGDNLQGRGGDDTLTGGDADDVLDGGAGADAMAGGAGDDAYFVDDAGDTVAEQALGGTDRVVASVSHVLAVDAEVEQLNSRGNGTIDLTGSDTANAIVANNAANVLSGLGGDDRISARGGDDTLVGGEGNDTLIGGIGADAMTGSAGNDIYYVDDAGDTVTEATAGGRDLVYLDAGWTLAAGQEVEFLIARGGADLDVTGNEFGQTIQGNLGANRLLGGGGDDVIHAGVGDTADGGAGADDHVVTGGAAGEIRVMGDAGDSIATTDAGWRAAGEVLLDGVLVGRWVKGATTLLADAAIDMSGIQTAPAIGDTVNVAGFDRQVIDLTTLSTAQGFIVQGDVAHDAAGRSVSSAGDVNGDGFDDLIVGAHRGDDGGTYAGEAYVVFGSGAGFGATVGSRQVIDLTSLSAAQGFIIQGDTERDYAGRSVSSAGDVNGDGFDDLIVGAYGGDDGGTDAGEAYVVFGSGAGFGATVNTGGFDRQVIDLTSLSASQGFIIQGDTTGTWVNPFGRPGDRAGISVSSVGDVNGDSFDDLVVGAISGDDGGDNAGEAYVIFGAAASFGNTVTTNGISRQIVDLTTLSVSQGFIIQGDVAGDLAGSSVSSVGDVNGDGFDDFMVGAPGGDDGGLGAGEAYVVFGSASVFGNAVYSAGFVRQVIDLTSLSAAQGFIIQGGPDQDQAGENVSSAGDVNGDGLDDLLIGASWGDDGGDAAGEAYIVFGSNVGFGVTVNIDGIARQVIDLNSLDAVQGFIVQGDASVDFTGSSISPAGDVNGDGFDDLVVGAFWGDDGGAEAGEAYVLFGGGGSFGVDVDGRQVIDLTGLSAAQGFIIQGDSAGDLAGGSVSSAGDVNGDGFDDLIVGARQGKDGGTYAGEAYVVFGGPAGFELAQVAGATDGGDTLAGTAAAERLIGGRGDDTLIGNGGADVFIGGAGSDIIDIGTGSFFRIDGGTGDDTLRVTGDLDFTRIDDVMVKGMEIIDVAGNGGQTMTFDALDVLALGAANGDVLGTTHDNVLIFAGDAEDTLHLAGLSAAGAVSFNGNDWTLYAIGAEVVLAVDADVVLV